MKLRSAAALVVLSVLLTGCAGRMTATDVTAGSAELAGDDATSAPASAALQLSSTGIGDLVLGQPIPASSTLVTWDDYCGQGSPQWVSSDAVGWNDLDWPPVDETGAVVDADGSGDPTDDATDYPVADPGALWVAVDGWTKDGALSMLWLTSSTYSTTQGIHLGSTISDLRAAYPDLVEKLDAGDTTIYATEPTDGTMLAFEVIWDDRKIGKAGGGTVMTIDAQSASDEVHSMWGHDGIPGSCM